MKIVKESPGAVVSTILLDLKVFFYQNTFFDNICLPVI